MLKNIYTVRPNEIEPGDVFAVTVTCHVDYLGNPRLYRCPYPNAQLSDGGVPQGDRIFRFSDEVTQALFPSVAVFQTLGE